MKTSAYTKMWLPIMIAALQIVLVTQLKAQICQNSLDSVYSLNTTGMLYPINVNTAGNGTPINASSGTAVNSNGLGFSTLYGRFYYFNQDGSGTTQFVSYNPVSHAVVTQTAPPATILTSQKIRSGCVNNLGSFYYTINPDYNGTTTPALYCYNIATLAWTTITTSFVDPSAVSLNTTFHSLNSGDMAFDGSGNLWVLLSNATQYALYKIAATVPTTVVASVTAQQIIAPTATPGGVSITGLAFNSAGKLFLSTGAGGGAGNNLLYKLSSIGGALTLVGTLPVNDIGADLTSCVAPMSVLPIATLLNFTAALHNDAVDLTWTAMDDESTSGYHVEYSNDGEHWTVINAIEKKYFNAGTVSSYKYTSSQYGPDNNFYRIVQLSADGSKKISVVKLINTGKKFAITIGPNPVKDIISIYNADNAGKYLAQVFDRTGRMLYSSTVDQTQQQVNISHLQKGNYILKLSSPVNDNVSSFQFIKW